MSLSARHELIASLRARYVLADRTEKANILNEFTATTGLHRKYAISVLKTNTSKALARNAQKRVGRYIVDPEIWTGS